VHQTQASIYTDDRFTKSRRRPFTASIIPIVTAINIRLQPLFGSSCIGTNTFSSDSLTFTNFNGLKGVGAAIAIASGIEFKARIKSSICVITAT
jgi:hypothetical protein